MDFFPSTHFLFIRKSGRYQYPLFLRYQFYIMKKLLLIFTLNLVAFCVKSQTVVFVDDYNRTSLSPGGSPAATYNTTLGNGNIATTFVSGSNYRLDITSGTGGAANARNFFAAPLSVFSAPFSTTLSANPGLVTWTFNMRTNTAVTGVPLQATMGGGVDLCGDAGANVYSGAPNGYGVIFNSSATGGVSLVKFNGGLNGSTVLITGTTTMVKTNFYSVRVTYNPATNGWSLFVRDDGATAFADPSTGVTTQQGSTVVDATYVNQVNTNWGAVYTNTAGTGKTMSIDNFQVALTLPACSGTPAPGNTVASIANDCTGYTPDISLQNTTSGSGVTYQWLSAPDVSGVPGTFTNVSGATSSVYSPTVSSVIWYKADVTCAGNTGTSTPVQLVTKTCYTMVKNNTLSATTCGGYFYDAGGSQGNYTNNETNVYTFYPGATGTGSKMVCTFIAYNSEAGWDSLSVYNGNSTGSPLIDTYDGGSIAAAGIPASITSTAADGSLTFRFISDGSNVRTGFEAILSNTNPNPVTVQPAVTTTACIGSNTSVSFTAGGTNGYQWYNNGTTNATSGGTLIPGATTTSYSPSTAAIGTTYFYCTVTNACGVVFTTNTAAVVVNAVPTIASIGVSPTTLCPSGVLGFTAGTASGTGTLTSYNWTGPNGYNSTTAAASQSYTIPATTAAGIYSLTVTYPGAGCTSLPASSTAVTVNSSPTAASLTPSPTTLCAGATLTLNAGTVTGSGTLVSYNWTGPAGYSTATTTGTQTYVIPAVSANGTYSLSVTYTGAGCTSTMVTAPVTVNALPTISSITASPSVLCVGNSLTLTAAGATGTGTATYNWSGPAGYNSATATAVQTYAVPATTASGVYSLSVTYPGSGCTSATVSSAAVTVNSLPDISNFSMSATGPCQGSGAGVTVSSSSLGNGTYTATYNVSGANTSSNNTISVTLSGGSGTFTVPSSQLGTTGGTTITITAISAGAGCNSTLSTGNTATFTVTALPATVTVSGAGTYCGSTTITAANGNDGTIYFQGTTANGVATTAASTSEVITTSGTYYFRARSATGCWGTQGSVIVSINPLPATVVVSGGGSYCGSTTVTAANGGDGTIYFQGTTATGTSTATPSTSQSITTSGTYYFRAQSAAGCWGAPASVAVTINAIPASVTVTGGGFYCGSGTITAANGSDGTMYFQGTTSNGTSTATPSNSQLITSSNVYYFRAQSSAGCWSNQGSAIVIVNPVPVAVTVSTSGTYCGPTTVTAANGGDGTIYFQGTTSGGTSTAVASTSEVLSSSGTYYFRAQSSAGCWGTEGSVTVTINAVPASTVVSGTGTFCESTTITATNGGDGTMYFQGTTPGGTSTAIVASSRTVTSTGVYYFRAQSAQGCWGPEGSVAVTVNPLPAAVTVTGGGTYCGAATITASNGGDGTIYFQGTTSGGTSVLNQSSSEVIGTSGTYYFRALSAQGCWGQEGSVTVTVNPIPAIVTVSGSGTFCGSTTITAANGNDGTIYYQGLTAMGTSTVTPSVSEVVNATGTYYFRALSAAGCWSDEGNVTVIINPLPADVTVSGAGTFCGATTITADNGGDGTMYFQGTTAGGTSTVTPSSSEAINTSGTYYFRAQSADGCWSNQGSAAVTVNHIPAAVTVSGGGTYCGGTTITAANGADGTIYFQGTTPGGTSTATASVSESINASGTYYFRARSAAGCWGAEGSVAVVINSIPAAAIVSGAGTFCGSTTITAGNGGEGTMYFQGTTSGGVSTAAPSVSAVISTSGIYYFRAQSAAGCWGAEGSATVTVNPVPDVTLFTIASESPCFGLGAEVAINPTSLTDGNYTLTYSLAGSNNATGNTISFSANGGAGTFTIPSSQLTAAGATTVTVTSVSNSFSCASNPTTGNTATFTVNPLPATVAVSGGGVFCNSATITATNGGDGTIFYQGTATGGVSTTIPSVSEVVGDTGIYYFRAQSAEGCWGTEGSAAVTVNPLPAVHNVTGTGHYCSGATGINIGLDGSETGILYQLYDGSSATGGLVNGNGGTISFGTYTTASTYTVVATDAGTACVSDMAGNAIITIDTLPAVHNVTGDGSYCAGGAGVDVLLDGSNTGINYQLYNGATPIGGLVAGTGSSINFNNQTLGGTYTVVAMDGITACTSNMTGSATVTVNPLPALHTITGGGHYCAGATGRIVGIDGSDLNINYQLYNGTTTVGGIVAGTNSPITFGTYTVAGVYSVLATDAGTGCPRDMTGATAVMTDPLPTVHNVTGGGIYCDGGAGVPVGVDGSENGINYTLYNGAALLATVAGVNGPISFGQQTTAATYTVQATDANSGCIKNMAGNAMVEIRPLLLPAVHISADPGTAVCSGLPTTFTTTTLNEGTTPTYNWTVNGIAISGATNSTFTTATLNDGDAVAVNLHSNAVCATPDHAADAVNMTVITSRLPEVSIAAAPGTSVCQGTMVNFSPTPVYGGSAPQYLWFRNGVHVSAGPTYSYIPVNGDVVYCKMLSNLACRTEDTVSSNSQGMTVNIAFIPLVSISVHPGSIIHPGQRDTLVATVTNGGAAPTYQWQINGADISGATNATFVWNTFANNDMVTCNVEGDGPCGLPSFNTVFIKVTPVGIAVVAAATGDVRLVPNPNKGTFMVKGELGTAANEEVTIEVTDMMGRTVYANKLMAANGKIEQQVQLDNALANGMYFLNVKSANDNKVIRFVIAQ